MLHALLNLLFPPRCVLCRKFLDKNETDLCHTCRCDAPEAQKSNLKLSFVADWTAVWYYRDNVRKSLLRYKFSGKRSYAAPYGRILAMKLEKEDFHETDILTYVPISPLRRLTRGFDQVELLAKAVGTELNMIPVQTLKKIRHTRPQSSLRDPARRRANVLGAYKALEPEALRGKRILLLDDVITTGATASECARVLLTAGAKEVSCAALAVAHTTKK